MDDLSSSAVSEAHYKELNGSQPTEKAGPSSEDTPRTADPCWILIVQGAKQDRDLYHAVSQLLGNFPHNPEEAVAEFDNLSPDTRSRLLAAAETITAASI